LKKKNLPIQTSSAVTDFYPNDTITAVKNKNKTYFVIDHQPTHEQNKLNFQPFCSYFAL